MPDTDKQRSYSAQEYFAFVEDDEWLNSGAFEKVGQQWWAPIVLERARRDLDVPARLVWLDCVSANYFMSLPWRDEICQIGNPQQSERRRRFINELDPSQFLIVPLFLSAKELETSLDEADWHRVWIDKEAGLPILASADYDFEGVPADLRYLRYEAECSEPERISLRNVFNLNFLPDARLEDDKERITLNTPVKPRQSPKVEIAVARVGVMRR